MEEVLKNIESELAKIAEGSSTRWLKSIRVYPGSLFENRNYFEIFSVRSSKSIFGKKIELFSP